MDKELEEWYKLHKFYLHTETYQTKQLAEYLGVMPKSIYRWITGKCQPSRARLDRIREYLSSLKK